MATTDWTCAICLERAVDAVETNCCGNVLCRSEASVLERCPYCRHAPLQWSMAVELPAAKEQSRTGAETRRHRFHVAVRFRAPPPPPPNRDPSAAVAAIMASPAPPAVPVGDGLLRSPRVHPSHLRPLPRPALPTATATPALFTLAPQRRCSGCGKVQTRNGSSAEGVSLCEGGVVHEYRAVVSVRQKGRLPHGFNFDWVFEPRTPPAHVFAGLGLAAIRDALGGYPVSVITIGEAGSGKTHTSIGKLTDTVECGLFPRICEALVQVSGDLGIAVEFSCVDLLTGTDANEAPGSASGNSQPRDLLKSGRKQSHPLSAKYAFSAVPLVDASDVDIYLGDAVALRRPDAHLFVILTLKRKKGRGWCNHVVLADLSSGAQNSNGTGGTARSKGVGGAEGVSRRASAPIPAPASNGGNTLPYVGSNGGSRNTTRSSSTSACPVTTQDNGMATFTQILGRLASDGQKERDRRELYPGGNGNGALSQLLQRWITGEGHTFLLATARMDFASLHSTLTTLRLCEQAMQIHTSSAQPWLAALPPVDPDQAKAEAGEMQKLSEAESELRKTVRRLHSHVTLPPFAGLVTRKDAFTVRHEQGLAALRDKLVLWSEETQDAQVRGKLAALFRIFPEVFGTEVA
eukprot:TRINITY_DN67789_c0_g1_i1.p1 TRINITY_DN67789_c0_g1~~TRINITY_DN67789_c0_g1_i1.p1  ORF type:complete len:632 (-),score=73.76 TRINITY_DN67789_c0_g1_i1:12-1907(-)